MFRFFIFLFFDKINNYQKFKGTLLVEVSVYVCENVRLKLPYWPYIVAFMILHKNANLQLSYSGEFTKFEQKL